MGAASGSGGRLVRTRVLRVIARMNVGGPALQVVGLTQGLDSDEFESRLLTGSVDENEADYLNLRAPDASAIRIDGLGRSVRMGGDVRAFGSILGEIRRFRPHIVHTHTAKAGVLGRLAAAVGRVPWVVHTFHGHLLHGYFSPAVTRAVIQTERTMARLSSALAAVGSQVRDDLLAAGIGRPEQYVVIPPGVDLPAAPLRSDARRTLGIETDVPVVTYVARLTSIKRPDRFVEMAHRLGRDHPRALFLVLGGGELLPEMRRNASALGDRMRFLGWRSDVQVVYAASDVVVLTSDNEGMPVTLIEAATLGVPAVATRVGSVDEVVIDGETGLLTRADPSELAAAVSRLLVDPERRERMGKAAAAMAKERFGTERLVRDTADLYRSLLQSKPLRGMGR